ncbi:MAG: 50S ribosomal protein L22 [Acidobacteria bacterium]|nr:50S ribosomal protein L22 [Acidobacteriota bacterium]
MEARAEAKFVRVSPRKARLVLDMIRGKDAGLAMNTLRFTKKRVAEEVGKVLRCAIANAEGKSETVDVDDLYVSGAYANDGPRAKRIRPAPMGRAYRYQRRTAHIIVEVAEKHERANSKPLNPKS